MMRMSLSMTPRMRTDLILALSLTGGATESLFPLVEVLLKSKLDYQRALKYVGCEERLKDYESVVDFLFCELHPRWKMSCRAFYHDVGPPLRELIDPEVLGFYSDRMLAALEQALDMLNDDRHVQWGGSTATCKRSLPKLLKRCPLCGLFLFPCGFLSS